MGWLENLDCDVRQGDILWSETEAIGVTIECNLDRYGRISRGVYRQGGARLEADLRQAVAERGQTGLKLGQRAAVPAHPESSP